MANNLKIEGGYFVITDTIAPNKEFIREVRDEVKFNRDTNDVYRFIFNTNTTAGTSLNYTLGGELTEYTFANFIDDRTGVAFTNVDELDDFLSLNIGFFADASVISGYNLLQEEGAPITKRQIINFIGDNVTVLDDLANLRSNVTINSSVLPSNYKTIENESKFTESGGETIIGPEVYLLGPGFVFTRPLNLDGASSATYLIVRGIALYTGTAPFLTSTSFVGAFEFNDAGIIFTNSAPIFAVTGGGGAAVGNAFISRNATFVNAGSVGFIKSMGGGVVFGDTQFSNCGTGLQLKDNAFDKLNILTDNSGGTTNSPILSFAGSHGDIDIMSTRLEMNAGESYIQIAPNTIFSRMDPAGIPFSLSDGGEFLASAKSNTALAITDNGSSKVRLTWSGHLLTIEQVLTLSNAVTFPAYDGNHDVLSIVSVNVIDLDTAYLGDDTIDATTGDTNDFFAASNYTSRGNGDEQDTKAIGGMHCNSNATVTLLSLNVWTDLNLNGNAVPSSSIQRFTVTNSTTGELRMDDTKPLSGVALVSITGIGQSGQDDYEFRVVKNSATLPNDIVAGTSTNANDRNICLVVPITADKNDLFRIQVRNSSGGDDFTIKNVSIQIQ